MAAIFLELLREVFIVILSVFHNQAPCFLRRVPQHAGVGSNLFISLFIGCLIRIWCSDADIFTSHFSNVVFFSQPHVKVDTKPMLGIFNQYCLSRLWDSSVKISEVLCSLWYIVGGSNGPGLCRSE